MGANDTEKITYTNIINLSLHEMKLKKTYAHITFIENNVLNVMGYVSRRASLPRKVQ